MREFKAGDKVYCPTFGPKVYTAASGFDGSDPHYPITVSGDTFSVEGKLYARDLVGRLIHATPENHELLEKLYGVEFEKPPRLPTGNEVIQAMLARGDKYVPCWVSDGNPRPNSRHELEFVVSVALDLSYVTTSGNVEWNFATPFDPRTGEAITELPE